MSSKIRILDEHTINKIAAGEVVESPASVVKELMENSIDAGATEIHVEVVCGGRQLIRVTDNGCGMNRDDALLCLERYATSKINQVDDLESLSTMGFRGEALPSIASVSKMTLVTAVEQDPQGTLVIVDGGKIIQCCSAARSTGTTIEVKSLFYNVPVRRKFQKSPAYDMSAVAKTVGQLALAHPDIRFELIGDQQAILVAPAATGEPMEKLSQRIVTVLGNDFYSHALPVDLTSDGYRVMGFIGSPTHHQPNRMHQHLFINRRSITSPLVSAAIREGYASALPAQRFPAFVLDLQLPGDVLDVNVHPQKREVRLRQEQKMRTLLYQMVAMGLRTTPKSPVIPLSKDPPLQWDKQPLPWDKPHALFQMAESPAAAPPVESAVMETLYTPEKPHPRVLATFKGYLILDPASCAGVASSEQGLWIVDQHAAHFRILNDRLLSSSHPVHTESQLLLIPITISLNPVEMDAILQARPDFSRLGIEIEPFGPHSLSIQSIPAELEGAEIANLLMEYAREFQAGERMIASERLKHIALLASRAAVTRTMRLNLVEANQLIAQLFLCDNPYRCPRGKPTMICLSPEALTKQFQK